MKATNPTGELRPIENCWIDIPGYGQVQFRVVPDIGDAKSAVYSDETIIGRGDTIKTYSHSDTRTISLTMTLISESKDMVTRNIEIIRAIQSCAYPRDDFDPYRPPAICEMKCGKLLGEDSLCVILRNYNVKYPKDVPWDAETYLPYMVDVSMEWNVVYASSSLPGADQIMDLGS